MRSLLRQVLGVTGTLPAVLALSLALAAEGRAAPAPTPAAPTAPTATAPAGAGARPKVAPKRRPPKAPPKIVEMEAETIEGRILKPEVFYVLGRAESRYRGFEVRRSFVPEIVESLKQNPL